MRKEIQLYEYQKDMLRQIEDAFGTHQSVMVQMPTGTGKTVLISEVVKREERRVKNPCMWIVVHRRELVEQIKETLERRLGTSLDAEREKQNAQIAGERKAQVGTGDRSERIRTYNYPQGRVSDHRINLTLYKLEAILNGDMDELIDALITADTAEKLKAQGEE